MLHQQKNIKQGTEYFVAYLVQQLVTRDGVLDQLYPLKFECFIIIYFYYYLKFQY